MTTIQDSAFWTARVGALDTQIQNLQAIQDAYVADRAACVTAVANGAPKAAERLASLNDPGNGIAIAALGEARAEALQHLAAARAADAVAAREDERQDAIRLVEKRIAAAIAFDEAAAAMGRAFDVFVEAGADLTASPFVNRTMLSGPSSFSATESLVGTNRLMGAVPPFIKKHAERYGLIFQATPFAPLAPGEASLWPTNLRPTTAPARAA